MRRASRTQGPGPSIADLPQTQITGYGLVSRPIITHTQYTARYNVDTYNHKTCSIIRAPHHRHRRRFLLDAVVTAAALFSNPREWRLITVHFNLRVHAKYTIFTILLHTDLLIIFLNQLQHYILLTYYIVYK